MFKDFAGVFALTLIAAAYYFYCRDIVRGKTRPHIYSWTLWGILTALMVVLQLQGRAGTAVFVTAFGCACTFTVVALSLKYGAASISSTDHSVAVLAVGAILAWLLIDNALVALVIAICADALAFFPTVRSAWRNPYHETRSYHLINAARFSLALIAVDHYTFLSSSWMVAWIFASTAMALLLTLRRRAVAPQSTDPDVNDLGSLELLPIPVTDASLTGSVVA